MPRHTEGPWMPSDDISRSSKSGLSSCSLHDLIALNPSVVDQITSFEVGDQQTARLQTPRRTRHCRRWRLWHRRNSRSNDPVRSMCSFPLFFTAPPKEPRRATEKRRRLPERRAPHRRSTPVAYPFRVCHPTCSRGNGGSCRPYSPSLASSRASARMLFFKPGSEIDSLGLCALAFGSSGPVTNT